MSDVDMCISVISPDIPYYWCGCLIPYSCFFVLGYLLFHRLCVSFYNGLYLYSKQSNYTVNSGLRK